MQRDHNLPARRSLMSQPQKLGVLPTYWFWNDRERQRLVLPLIALVALPVTPLLFLLLVKLQLPIWFLLAGMLYPYLVMGLVERHIRTELRRRPVGANDSPQMLAPSVKSQERALPATLALVSLIFAILALLNVGGTVMLVAFVAGVAAITATVFPHTRKISNQLDKTITELPPGSRDAG